MGLLLLPSRCSAQSRGRDHTAEEEEEGVKGGEARRGGTGGEGVSAFALRQLGSGEGGRAWSAWGECATAHGAKRAEQSEASGADRERKETQPRAANAEKDAHEVGGQRRGQNISTCKVASLIYECIFWGGGRGNVVDFRELKICYIV